MRLFGRCKCEEIEEEVSLSSPARALSRSLTEPETRGEWTSEVKFTGDIWTYHTRYENTSRDLVITKNGYGVSTPFTLTKAEEAMVKDALEKFEAHKRSIREAEALSRLTAELPNRKPRGKVKG